MDEIYKVGENVVDEEYVKLNNKILKTAVKYGSEFIETNGNLSSYIQMDSRFVFSLNFGENPYNAYLIKGQKIDLETDPYGEEDWDDEEDKHIQIKYKLGHIGNKKIIVDPYLKWNENIIYFKNEKQETLHILIIEDPKKILA